MIIGVTGLIGSGKGVFSEYLKIKGFKKFSFSDVLRDECKKRSIEISRNSLTCLANELRSSSAGAIAKLVIEKINYCSDSYNFVVDGFRHPDEVLEFRKRGDFVLVAVFSDQFKRFERVNSRNRESDPKSFEEFKILDSKEFNSTDSFGIQICNCINLSDFSVKNDSTLFEFYSQIDFLLENVVLKGLL